MNSDRCRERNDAAGFLPRWLTNVARKAIESMSHQVEQKVRLQRATPAAAWQRLNDRFLAALHSFLSNRQKPGSIQILHTCSSALVAKHQTLRSSLQRLRDRRGS